MTDQGWGGQQQPWQQQPPPQQPPPGQQGWPQQEQPQQGWQQPPPQQQQPWPQQGWQQQPPPGQPGWQQGQPQQGWQQLPGSPQGNGGYGSGRVRYAPGPGLAVGAIGLICLILSLFALTWAKGSDGKFLDLAKALRNIPSGADLNFAQHIEVAFGAWAAFVLFGLTVVLVILAGIPLPQTAAGNTYARIVGALVVGLGAVGQIVTMTQAFKGDPTPQFGAWLGVIGWFVVAVGFVLGARRTTT